MKHIYYILFILIFSSASFKAKSESLPAPVDKPIITFTDGTKFEETQQAEAAEYWRLNFSLCVVLNDDRYYDCSYDSYEMTSTQFQISGAEYCYVSTCGYSAGLIQVTINYIASCESLPEYPIEIDNNGDGVPEFCQKLPPDCDCTENLDSTTNQCVARDIIWPDTSENLHPNLETGGVVRESDENNQGLSCGIFVPDQACAGEGPIKNMDEFGNPISCASGQKIQSELDYQSSVGNLNFSRTYIQEPEQVESGQQLVQFDRSILPDNIQIIYDNEYRIASDFYNFWTPNVPQLEKSGTRLISFTNGRGSRKNFIDSAAFRAQQGTITESAGTTIHRTIGGTEYHFNSDNKLIKKVYRNGQFQDYSYPNADQLVITDNFGRSLTIDYVNLNLPFYGIKQFVSKLTDPAGNEYLYEYDNLGQLTKVIYPDETPADLTDNPFKAYGYQDLGGNHQGLSSITDELGADYANWTYDSFRRATSSEHSGSAEKVTIDYTNPISEVASSSVKHYRDATNFTETLYDFKKLNGAYKPLKISTQPCPDCVVGETNYEYDTEGYLSQITHHDGTITQYQYNSRGLQESRTEAFGTAEQRIITTTWHGSYNLPLSVDEPQRLTTYAYDATGNLLSRSVKDKATNETRTITYTYNSVGQVLTVNGARTDVSDITTYEYDASGNGNLVKVINALGHETLITAHDAHGKPLSVTDPNGTLTSMTYHPRGWLTSITTDGDTTNYSYDDAGQLTTVTMANGVTLSYEYDAAQRLKAIVDAQGNRIEYTLDLMGNRTRSDIKDSSGTIKSFATSVFNDLGRLKETLGANNQSNKVNYDAEGYPTDTTDALNNVSSNQYDALDRLTKAVDPDLGETEFGYDSHDRLTSVTDATNKTTSYVYNAFGEVLSQTSPDTGTSSFSYDLAGNLLTATDARNITSTYSYDALNRVTAISYPDTSENVTFTYDETVANNKGIGRLTRIDDESGSTAYLFDGKGQLIQETRRVNDLDFVTAYQYDASGLLTQMTYPSGRLVNYVRNNLGQVVEVTSTVSGVTQTIASNVSYLPFGPMDSLTYGNGKVLTQSFDQDYRLTNKSVTGVNDLTYGYTPRNNINSILDSFDASFDQSFSYDNLARLTDATGQYGDQDYSFDAIGNRLSKTQDGATENYQYDPASHRLTQAGTTNFTNDAVGNVLTKDDLTFSYNQMGRMVTAAHNSMSASYQYNTQGQRVKKTVDSEVTLYHYDQAGQLIAQTDASGNIIQEYIYLDGMRLANVNSVEGGADPNNKTVYFDGENGALNGWTIFDNNPAGATMTNEFDAELNSNVIVLTGDGTKNGFRLKNANNKNWNNKTQYYLSWQQKTSAMLMQVKIASNEGNKTIVYYSKAGTDSVSSNGNAFKIYLGNEARNNTWQTFTRDLQADLSSLSSTIQLTNVKFIQVKGHGRLDNIALMGHQDAASALMYVHTNHLDAPIALTDSAGDIQWQGSYDPYGNLSVQIDNVSQDLRFPGQLNDAETGNYYNYFRDYDPEIGRYLQSDPIGLNGGINTYGYVGANPINYVDPYGLDSWDIRFANHRAGNNPTYATTVPVNAGDNFVEGATTYARGHYRNFRHLARSQGWMGSCEELKAAIEGLALQAALDKIMGDEGLQSDVNYAFWDTAVNNKSRTLGRMAPNLVISSYVNNRVRTPGNNSFGNILKGYVAGGFVSTITGSGSVMGDLRYFVEKQGPGLAAEKIGKLLADGQVNIDPNKFNDWFACGCEE